MNPKIVSTLLIVGTLLVGIVLGVVGNGALQNKRMKELSKIRNNPRGFSEFVIRTVQPADDAQRLEVEQILEKYGAQYRVTRDRQQKEMEAIGDSMRAEMKLILSPEQYNALEEMFENRRKRDDGEHGRKKRKGPGPDSLR